MWSVSCARLHLCCEEVSIICIMYFQLTFHCHAHQINYDLVTPCHCHFSQRYQNTKSLLKAPTPSPYFCLHIISSIKIAADIYSALHGNILNKDITSHKECFPPHILPGLPSYITCRKYANRIYVFYASDSVYYAGMNLYGLCDEPCCTYISYHYSCIEIYWGILCIRSCRWSPLELLLSCPDHISWYSFVKVMVFHNLYE